MSHVCTTASRLWLVACIGILSTTCSTISNYAPAERVELDPEPTRGAFVWRGHRHAWTYNHRVNRLGDYLTPLDCTNGDTGDDEACSARIVHTGASGTGSDTATFTSYYTEVHASGARFHSGEVSLSFDGREQRNLRVEQTVQLESAGRFGPDGEYAVLLNGYDLYVDGKRAKAKKIKQFRIWARNAEYADGGVAFDVGGLLNMNCDSVECKHQSNHVRYTMDVRFVVVGHDEGGLHATTKPFETSYRWSKRREIEPEDVPLNASTNHVRGLRKRYDMALVGFRAIDFDLAKKGRYKDHWYVNWTHSIRNVDYEPSSGEASFDLELFFKEWNKRTKKKVTSLARRGEAILRADTVLLQFERGRTRRAHTSGEIEWPGKNRSPIDDAAVWKKELSFE
jgi:hypothetical protein